MAGLVPAIHVLLLSRLQDVDARDKRGHDGVVGPVKRGNDGWSRLRSHLELHDFLALLAKALNAERHDVASL
jgi:hypothetical protein